MLREKAEEVSSWRSWKNCKYRVSYQLFTEKLFRHLVKFSHVLTKVLQRDCFDSFRIILPLILETCLIQNQIRV